MIEQLRKTLRALERPPALAEEAEMLSLGVPAVDAMLGGGLPPGALHEITAAGEAHVTVANGFALGLIATRPSIPRQKKSVIWIAEDMALAESGMPCGAGLYEFGLAPDRLLTVAAASRDDLLWAMEEALRCRAAAAVIGELRHQTIDAVATRRLALAAAGGGTPALLLRSAPVNDASTAATRWIVGAAPSLARHGPGPPRFTVDLVRNRRGPLGSWMLEWSFSNERFVLAYAQPVAAPVFHRPHRKVA